MLVLPLTQIKSKAFNEKLVKLSRIYFKTRGIELSEGPMLQQFLK